MGYALKVESSPEVLDLLFRRLDIQWQDDPAFCREAAAWFEEYYDRLFSGEDLQDMTQELLLRETVYRNSPFFLDWLLLSWAATGQVQEEVEEFVSAMDARQQNLHLCLKGQFQDLLRIAERSYFFLQAGMRTGGEIIAMRWPAFSRGRSGRPGRAACL